MAVTTEQQFGIVSDLFGTKQDVPTVKLKASFMPESQNVFLDRGAIKAMPGAGATFLDSGSTQIITPDANPIIHYHRHISATQVEYVFAYTKAHVYYWNNASGAFTLYFTCTSDCTLWDTASIDGKIVSTNNVDLVQVWDETTPGTTFADLDSASGLDLGGSVYLTKAAYLTTYENYLILGDTTEGGTRYGTRIRWCTYGDITDYDETGTGDTGAKDFDQGYGTLKGFGHYAYQGADVLVVFKSATTYPMWLVETSDVWFIGDAEGNVGLLATHGVANDGEGRLYFIGSDYHIRMWRGPVLSKAVKTTLKGISPTYEAYIEAAFIEPYNQIWWSIPSSGISGGNDKIVALNIEEGFIWHEYTFSIRAFGQWSQQASVTIDGLDDLSSTIDGLDAALSYIDYVEGLAGFPLDLGSDYSGYTWSLHTSETDMGSSLTRNFVLSTDLTKNISLREFKRPYQINTYLKSRATDTALNLFVKEDSAVDWETVGSLDLDGSAETIDVENPCDLRGKHFLFKYETTTLFEFIAVFFLFEFDGMY